MLPRSLAGRLALLLLVTLVVAQGASLFLFSGERLKAVRAVHRANVVQRTVGLVHLIRDTPETLHERVVAAASSGFLRFRLVEIAPAPVVRADDDNAREIALALAAALDLPAERVRVTAAPYGKGPGVERDEDDGHDHHWREKCRWRHRWLTISLGLPDGRWLQAETGPPPGAPRWGGRFLVALLVSATAVALVAVLVGRRIAAPMRGLAEAADRVGRGETVAPLAETGPEETRRTIRAFNLMRERLDRYITDRTSMLAAISHDLRTPITSLRLRAEFIEDEEIRERILATLDEMQAMTESTLDFIREDARSDPGRPTDLLALVESTVADFADTGRSAEFAGGDPLTLVCRPTALRRALRNLIDNAIAYGGAARVALEQDEAEARVVVDDEGTGILPENLERVFDPFVRLEDSRSRETGGAGLGLAIARSIARSHGGDVILRNRPEGGLRATLSLPLGVG